MATAYALSWTEPTIYTLSPWTTESPYTLSWTEETY